MRKIPLRIFEQLRVLQPQPNIKFRNNSKCAQDCLAWLLAGLHKNWMWQQSSKAPPIFTTQQATYAV